MLAKKLIKYQILFLRKLKRDLRSKMNDGIEYIIKPRSNYSVVGHKENISYLRKT